MKISFKTHVFLTVALCVVVFISGSRMLMRWTVGEPFQIYFSEALARQTQKEFDRQSGQLDLQKFQDGLEKTIDQANPGDLVVFSQLAELGDRASEFGQVVQSEELHWEELKKAELFSATNLTWNQKNWQVIRTLKDGAGFYVGVNEEVFAKSLKDIMEVRNQVLVTMSPILLIFVVVIASFIYLAVLSPIRKLQVAFAEVDFSKPHTHLVAKENFKELEKFIGLFNHLIDRLKASYTQASRFSSDAAHELRTPLTVIRGNLHRLIHQAQDGSSNQLQLTLVADEVERLISISNKLLFLSQADAGQIGVEKKEMNFSHLLGQIVDDAKSFNTNLHFRSQIESGILIQADPDLMFQLIQNMLSNAIKYNQSAGSIEVTANVSNHELNFGFINTTHLTTAGLNERVFERFYRYQGVAGHQVSAATGAGLGLSLCQEIIKVHGGSIHLSVDADQRVRVACKMPLRA